MPYKVFVAGEEALASDANSYLMSQTVPRFTNATQRTSQLTAPVLNQLSIRDDNPGVVERWNGSAWVGLAQALERYGTVTYSQVVGAAVEFTWTSFTMPFAGGIILDGKARFDAYAAGGTTAMNALVDVGPTSTPAASASPQFLGPTANANAYYATVPFSYHWATVAAGTSVTLKVRISTNAAGVTLTSISASVRILPGLF